MLTKKQWIGVGILVVLIGATKGVLAVIDHIQPPPSIPTLAVETPTAQDSAATIRLHVFDPNTADSVTLIGLGLRPWQVRNMLRYRAKGGRYHEPEDMQSLYGLTDSAYQQLRPYIQIDSTEWVARRDSFQRARWYKDSIRHHHDSLRYDSLLQARHYHPKRDTILEINAADTASLQYIRGVGRYLAIQIVRYRERLGGYVDVQQVREIPHTEMAQWDSIIPHLTVDTSLVIPIPVNHCSVERLSKHPYLRYEQAKAIYERRRQQFKLHSIDDLSTLPELSEEDRKRLQPYLHFE